MNEQEYTYIPNFKDVKGNKVLGREVTETFGVYIANKLRSELKIKEMNFPRLRFPRLLGLGYSTADYYEIARLLLSKDIRVYETKDTEKTDFSGCYHNSDKFIFPVKVTRSPDVFLGTIIHEVTHAIQDLRRWRECDRDREVDGHFAGALFMVLKNQDSLLTSKYQRYINLAKDVKANPNFFKTMECSRKIAELQNMVTQEYGWKYRDEPAKIEDFHKKQRWDGIGN